MRIPNETNRTRLPGLYGVQGPVWTYRSGKVGGKMIISFTVPGEPVAKARPRVFFNKKLGRAMAYTPKTTMSFEEHVRMCSLEHRLEYPLEGPISLTLRVYK